MASVAVAVRPSVVGAILLSAGLAVGLECIPKHERARRPIAVLQIPRPVIVPMELYRAPGSPGIFAALAELLRGPHADVIVPPPHPDAQPWPRGMVIVPPPFPDRIAVDLPTALDRVLSALLAPWRTIAS